MTARPLGFSLCVFLLVALTGPVLGDPKADQDPVAPLTATGTYLEWTPLVEAETIVLALADPEGEVRTVSFGRGEAPVLSLVDTDDQPLPDGPYMWELRLARARTPELERAMRLAERRGDHQQLKRLARLNAPLTQSGHFSLRNGSVVLAASVGGEEPERAEATGDDGGLQATMAAPRSIQRLASFLEGAFGEELLPRERAV